MLYEGNTRERLLTKGGFSFFPDLWNSLRALVAKRDWNEIEEIAKKKGVSMAQISLAWIMAKPGVSAPIIGTTSMANLEDILGKLTFLSLGPMAHQI